MLKDQPAPGDVQPESSERDPEQAPTSAEQVTAVELAEPATVLPVETTPTAVDPPAGRTGSSADAPVRREGAATARIEQSLRRHRKSLLGGVVVAFLAALYVADLVSGLGSVPRGAIVAGVRIGGLSTSDAERELRAALEPRSARPVILSVGPLGGQLDPRAAGLEIDWAATIERAADQPFHPFTRIVSFFADREADVVSTVDGGRVSAALDPLARFVERPPGEGSVRFVGLEPVPVDPVGGQRLDLPAAVRTIEREWLGERPVELSVIELPASTRRDDVRGVIDTVARPAVAAPVTITGDGARASLTPEVIASALSFRMATSAGAKLVPEINVEAVTNAVKPQLAPSERAGRNASLSFAGGAPAVVPAQDGRKIDYPATFVNLGDVLTRAGGAREITVIYAVQPAKVTTEEVSGLLSAGEISSFTTGGFAPDSGRNIRRAAEMINGSVVGPGETFSLNAATNPRDASNGFVEAGIIEEGRPARGIGGGVSQVATTLYNAAYFAGMVDVEHQEHSFYIGRYPVAREATVFDDVIDVKFRNDGPSSVLIRTEWTPSAIAIRMVGARIYEVTSSTGPRTSPTPPSKKTVSERPCRASKGSPGFTATDTRTVRDTRTGETRSQTRTVVYRPAPTIVCD